MEKVVVFGNGRTASHTYFYLTHDSPYEVAAFTVDREYIEEETLFGLPVVPFEDIESIYPFAVKGAAVNKSFQVVTGDQMTDDHADPLANHTTVGKDRKFYAVFVAKNGASVGAVKLGEGVLSVGLDVVLFKFDTLFAHKALGDLTPGTAGGRINSVCHGLFS